MTGAALLAAALTVLNGLSDVLPVFFAALLHEGGHALACRILHVPIRTFRPFFAGAVIGYDATVLSYGQEIFMAAAGPMVNLLCAAAMLCVTGRTAAMFGAASFALGVFNLLPLRQL